MRLLVSSHELKMLTDKVLKHTRNRGALDPTIPVRLASLPASLLGRVCAAEELRIEIEPEPNTRW